MTESTLTTDKLLAIARLAFSLIPEDELEGLEAEWLEVANGALSALLSSKRKIPRYSRPDAAHQVAPVDLAP